MSYDFADRLIEMRRTKSMSQEELASALGISRQAVSKWERAESAPDIGNLMALAELYGVSLDDLVRGNAAELAAKEDTADAKTEAPDADAADACEAATPASEEGISADAEPATITEPASSSAAEPDSIAAPAPSSTAAETVPATAADTTPATPTAAGTATPATPPMIGSAPAPQPHAAPDVAPTAAAPSAYEQAYSAEAASTTAAASAPAGSTAAPTPPSAPEPAAAPHRTSRAWQIFPYPLLCLVVFLFCGFFLGLWHPAWIVFVTIPFYYWVVGLILRDPNYIATHSTDRK